MPATAVVFSARPKFALGRQDFQTWVEQEDNCALASLLDVGPLRPPANYAQKGAAWLSVVQSVRSRLFLCKPHAVQMVWANGKHSFCHSDLLTQLFQFFQPCSNLGSFIRHERKAVKIRGHLKPPTPDAKTPT
jgi:hypothetical protein